MNHSIKQLLFVLLFAICASKVSAELVVYPQPGKDFKKHHAYPRELLELAIAKSGESFELVPSKFFMNQGRAIKQLAVEREIDILWTMTSTEREEALLPIRIPIYKGLIGWRVFLTRLEVNYQKTPLSLDQLRSVPVVQGHDWPDTDILTKNGFNVIPTPTYESNFKMVEAGRADLFPRSIIEVWSELDDRLPQNMTLEQKTLIHYPTASYFFVAPENKALKAVIEEGLRKAVADGSFDELFNYHFGSFISRANLSERHHHALENPDLPSLTPINEKALWFQPSGF